MSTDLAVKPPERLSGSEPGSPAGLDEEVAGTAWRRPGSVLLVRLLAFGDVLLTLPIVEALARTGIEVDLLTSTEFADDVRRSPFVRRVYSYDPSTGELDEGVLADEYDLVADLHSRAVPLPAAAEGWLGRLRGRRRVGYQSPYAPSYATLPSRGRAEHAVEYYARAVADLLDGPPGTGLLAIGDAERDAAAGRLPARPVCLAPGARYPWKRWPARSYAELAARLTDHGLGPVVVGHPFDEPHVASVLDLAPPGTPHLLADTPVLAVAMAAAGTVVANNSGLTALAACAGARVVCVHSHTLPAMWRPWGTGHVDVAGDGTDMPCGCSGAAPHDLATPCGKSIPVAEVLAATLLVTGIGSLPWDR